MRRKRAATYQRKRMWLGGICLSLSVAVAACGTDGRTAGSREAPDAQSMQEEQAVQKGQDKEGAQDRRGNRSGGDDACQCGDKDSGAGKNGICFHRCL